MTVAVTRTEHTAAALRRLAGGSDDAAVARRLLALALILDGHTRADAARLAGVKPRGLPGMDRQALRGWVHCYNADGVTGLADRHGGGVARRLSAEQEAAVAGWIRTGPDVARDKLVRWGCAGIQARLAELFGVVLHERSVGKSGKAFALPRWASRAKRLLCPGCAGCASPTSQHARAIPRRTWRRRHLSERVRRSHDRSPAQGRAGRGHTHRGLVSNAMGADTAGAMRSDWQASATREGSLHHAVREHCPRRH